MGVAGAAIATVIGQSLAAAITGIKGFYKPPKLNIFFAVCKTNICSRTAEYYYASIVDCIYSRTERTSCVIL